MRTDGIVQSLKQEAKRNPVFNSVCCVFALRKRTRFTLTIAGLAQKMTLEGFNYSTKEYAQVLSTLAALGLGELVYKRKGVIEALKGISFTLQSIGAAACGSSSTLVSSMPMKRFKTVSRASIRVERRLIKSPIGLTLYLKDKPVTVTLPKDASGEEIANIVKFFRSAS